MNIEQVIGWIGNILFFVGGIILARRNVLGFYANGTANLLYCVQAILMYNWSLLGCSMVLILVNLYGIIRWSKKISGGIDV